MIALRGEPGRNLDASMLQVRFERNRDAPALARAAVADFFDGQEIDPGQLATLTLLVSELVTNAVLYTDAPPGRKIILSAGPLGRGAVRVEITDQGSGFTPAPRDPSRLGGGYGLYLVETQSDRWGVDCEKGTCVWFEMSSRIRGA
jgi:anti-sigma regulatory factor (Ser/Thr protein kinase)